MAYDTAQICLNGHIITTYAQTFGRGLASDFCEQCGERTIVACPKCDTTIRGDEVGGSVFGFDYIRPNNCRACGTAYPWVQRALEAAQLLAQEEEVLTAEELVVLSQSLATLAQGETPQSPVAVSRTKRLFSRMGSETVAAIRDVTVDVISETIKKSLYPGT